MKKCHLKEEHATEGEISQEENHTEGEREDVALTERTELAEAESDSDYYKVVLRSLYGQSSTEKEYQNYLRTKKLKEKNYGKYI